MSFNFLDLLPWYCNAKIREQLRERFNITERSLRKILPLLLEEIEERNKKIQSFNQQLETAKTEIHELEKCSIKTSEEVEDQENKTLFQLAEKIAPKSRRGMEIFRIVTKYLEENATHQRKQSRMGIINGFPKEVRAGNMEGHKFIYEQSFLDGLRKLSKKDQQKLRHALQKFSEHGEAYPSLQTHAIPDDCIKCLPKGSSSSRASDELRFFWRDEDKKIHLYKLGRKGEKWLQNSEA